MTQPLVELRGLLRGLREYQVDYVLLVALAMTCQRLRPQHQGPRHRRKPQAGNLDRAAEWLISMTATLKLIPARPFGSRERWRMHKRANAKVLAPLGRSTLFRRLPGLPGWPQPVEEAEVYEIDGMRVPVMNRCTLIELKCQRGSHLDLAGIGAIRMLEEL